MKKEILESLIFFIVALLTFLYVKKHNPDKIIDRYSPIVCFASPILSYIINIYSESLLFGYRFGFEILLLNGLITFVGLFLISLKKQPH